MNKEMMIGFLYLLLSGPVQRAWLRFLKHNPNKQDQGSLGRKLSNGDYKACCLGQFGLMVGICEWSDTDLCSLRGDRTFPDSENMLKYGFFTESGKNVDNSKPSLSIINDREAWLDVYYACIDDPKGYFIKKV